MSDNIKNSDKTTHFPIQYEPKRLNRFITTFPEEFELPSWSVLRINKPKFTMGKWENITVVFLDPIGPSVSQGLYNVVNLLKTNTSNDEKLFDIKIDSLDPTGVVIETWLVEVENVLTINFGELDYAVSEIEEPYLTLKIKNCILY